MIRRFIGSSRSRSGTTLEASFKLLLRLFQLRGKTRRSALRSTTILLSAFGLGACAPQIQLPSQVYLNSSDTQKATQQAKDDFGKIQVDQYFADEQKGFVAFVSQEDTAVTEYLVALRNRDIANLLRKDVVNENPDTPHKTLTTLIDARLDEIVGKHNYTDRELNLLRDGPRRQQNHNSDQQGLNKFTDDARDAFVKSRGSGDLRPTECQQILDVSFPSIPECAAMAVDDKYQVLVCECARLQRDDILSGYAETINLLKKSNSGEWFDVNSKMENASKIIADDAKRAKQIQCIIAELKHTPDTSCPSDLSRSPDDVHRDLPSIITALQDTLAANKATPSSEPSPSPGAAATAGGGAKLVAAQGISGILEELLNTQLAVAAPKNAAKVPSSNPPTTGTSGVVTAASTTAAASGSPAVTPSPSVSQDALAAIKAIAVANLDTDSVNSVLVEIAAQQQQEDMAQLQIDYSKKLVTILTAERTALLYEVSALTEAKLDLKKIPETQSDGFARLLDGASSDQKAAIQKAAIGSGLSAYDASWNQGQIPFKVMEFKEIQIQRQYGVDVAAKTATNWKNLLAPALDELAAYGQGGIKPGTVAQLLFDSGIIAAVAVK